MGNRFDFLFSKDSSATKLILSIFEFLNLIQLVNRTAILLANLKFNGDRDLARAAAAPNPGQLLNGNCGRSVGHLRFLRPSWNVETELQSGRSLK